MLSRLVAVDVHSVYKPSCRFWVRLAVLFIAWTLPYRVADARSMTPLNCGVSRGVYWNLMYASPVVFLKLEIPFAD